MSTPLFTSIVKNVSVGERVEVFPYGYTQPFIADVKESLYEIDLALLQLCTAFDSQCVYLDRETFNPGINAIHTDIQTKKKVIQKETL